MEDGVIEIKCQLKVELVYGAPIPALQVRGYG